MLARNLRAGHGEVDLLVAFGPVVAAVEVKSRIGAEPEVSYAKAHRLAATLSRLNPRPQRLDVVTVLFERDGVWVRWVQDV